MSTTTTELSFDKVKEMLGKAFDLGQEFSGDMKQQVIEEIIDEFKLSEIEDLLKVWPIEELKRFKDGTIFHHINHGRGWVTTCATTGQKGMQFRTGKKLYFGKDGLPWNVPMKLIQKA